MMRSGNVSRIVAVLALCVGAGLSGVALAAPSVELTVDFAKSLVESEQLGQDDIPDYLSLSLSCTDYVGHLFGPASLESEENLLRLDRTLADLFRFIDEKVGLQSTLIVLAADHGTPDAPEYAAEKGLSAGRLNLDSVDYTRLDAELKRRFGIGKEVIKMTYHPYVYLDRELIQEKQLNLAEISRVVARRLLEVDGVAYAIPSTDLATGRVPDASPIALQALRNFKPKRSGDVYIIYEPHWCATYSNDIAVVNHGSPWVYDTYVPIIFSGWNTSPRSVYRQVETVDIAPTLALLLGTKLPSGSVGKPLEEVFPSRHVTEKQ